jgi:hypothetical protein
VASLSTLDPELRPTAELFFKIAHSVLPGLVVTSARRSWFEQLALWSKYKAKLALEAVPSMASAEVIQDVGYFQVAKPRHEKLIPAAPPGYSKHEQGKAFDLGRLNISPWEDAALPVLGSIWIKLGGIWRASDPVHFEV